MREIRASILEQRFLDFYREKRAILHASDVEPKTAPARPAARKKPRVLGDFEIHEAWEGFSNIRQISSGEIMHSRTAPMEEARLLYVEQSALAARLRLTPGETAASATPLVLWDVGLGAAANAMAAIHCYEAAAAEGAVRPLAVVSFENDLDALRLALAHEHEFPYLRHAGPAGILARGAWRSRVHAELSWILLEGDFRERLAAAPPPDLIFYDMFSSKSAGEPWAIETFRELHAACLGRAAELYTYTCSTANRAALLAAGFFVARGRNAGAKEETTIALTSASARAGHELLADEWLGKWKRSAAKFPPSMPVESRPEFERAISGHPQFQAAPARTG
jgi:queuine tRNA-ribosyltransferase